MSGIVTALGYLVKEIVFLVSYVKNNAFPQPLSATEERKYLQLMAEGDAHARNMLIEHNLRLVAHIVKKFENTGEDSEDLISIGTIGLIKAIESYSEAPGSADLILETGFPNPSRGPGPFTGAVFSNQVVGADETYFQTIR